MQSSAQELSDNVQDLQRLVRQQRADFAAKQQLLETKYAWISEQLKLLLAKRFGASSEQLDPQQLGLWFDEAEASVEDEDLEAIEVPAQARKRGRKPIPKHLPRIDVTYELDPDERVCPHDGAVLKLIGQRETEQFDMIPQQIQVIRHIQLQYACPCCDQTIKTAAKPKQPIPRSLASPGLLAHVAVAKYADHLPLYRQEQMLARHGMDLPRATLANWMIKAGQLIQPLIHLMRDQLLQGPVIQMDESPIQVLKEPGRAAQAKSYIWVQRGGPPSHPLILYDYDPSRAHTVPKRLLTGFEGYLQTDGYVAYDLACKGTDITQVGCMAHARRKFDEVIKALGKNRQRTTKAHMALNTIAKLYRIERDIRGASPEERYRVRQEQAKPLLDDFKRWAERSYNQVPPKSLTGKAFHYLLAQWDKLIAYLDDGRLEADNNRCEQAIRPFVTGRKNFLFCDTPRGAGASANLYSIIQTAKANGLEPYRYLRHVFKELPLVESIDDIEALLPSRFKYNTTS